MSAFDPKRTLGLPTGLHHPLPCLGLTIWGDDETPRVCLCCRECDRVATRSLGAAAERSPGGIFDKPFGGSRSRPASPILEGVSRRQVYHGSKCSGRISFCGRT